jgi:Flp pilus assembly protein TadD
MQFTVSFYFNRIRYLAVVVSIVALAACAAQPKAPTPEEQALAASENLYNGDVAMARGDMDRAIVDYVKALGHPNTRTPALEKIAYIHFDSNRWEQAERAYRELLAENETHYGAHAGLGIVLLRQGKHDEAEKPLQVALSVTTEDWQVHNAMAVVLDLKGNMEMAWKNYEAALKFRPNDPVILNNYGYSHYLSGDWVEAQQYFQMSIAIDQNYEQGWRNLGLVLIRRGDLRGAVDAFGRIMDKHKSLNTVGYVLLLEKEYEGAIRYFNQAIITAPSYYEAAENNLVAAQTASDSVESIEFGQLNVDSVMTEEEMQPDPVQIEVELQLESVQTEEEMQPDPVQIEAELQQDSVQTEEEMQADPLQVEAELQSDPVIIGKELQPDPEKIEVIEYAQKEFAQNSDAKPVVNDSQPKYSGWLDAKLQQSREWLSNAHGDKVSIQVLMRKKTSGRELINYLQNEWPLNLDKTYLYEVKINSQLIYHVFYGEFDTLTQGRHEMQLLPESLKVNSPYLNSVYRMQKALL